MIGRTELQALSVQGAIVYGANIATLFLCLCVCVYVSEKKPTCKSSITASQTPFFRAEINQIIIYPLSCSIIPPPLLAATLTPSIRKLFLANVPSDQAKLTQTNSHYSRQSVRTNGSKMFKREIYLVFLWKISD